mgnify:CR=1 FL=1
MSLWSTTIRGATSRLPAINRKFGETLKSKNPTAQVNKLLAKIIAYNLTAVIPEMYESGINPEFLQVKNDRP